METFFKAWKTSRKLYADFLDKYSLEQLNTVPAGFNNNLIWNIAHVVASHQSLIYLSSNHPMNVTDEYFNKYKPESKPTGPVSQSEVDEVKKILLSSVEQTEADYKAGKFTTYNERTTRTGFHLGNIEDALQFVLYHEGIHLGYMMSIRKFV